MQLPPPSRCGVLQHQRPALPPAVTVPRRALRRRKHNTAQGSPSPHEDGNNPCDSVMFKFSLSLSLRVPTHTPPRPTPHRCPLPPPPSSTCLAGNCGSNLTSAPDLHRFLETTQRGDVWRAKEWQVAITGPSLVSSSPAPGPRTDTTPRVPPIYVSSPCPASPRALPG